MRRQFKKKSGEDARRAVLFDTTPDWVKHWEGMPEYHNEDLAPKYQVVISFACAADVEEFAKLIGQPITARDSGRELQSFWFSRFTQRLKLREGVEIPKGVNNFGMVLQEKIDGKWVTQ